jgi:hypothetical protein
MTELPSTDPACESIQAGSFLSWEEAPQIRVLVIDTQSLIHQATRWNFEGKLIGEVKHGELVRMCGCNSFFGGIRCLYGLGGSLSRSHAHGLDRELARTLSGHPPRHGSAARSSEDRRHPRQRSRDARILRRGVRRQAGSSLRRYRRRPDCAGSESPTASNSTITATRSASWETSPTACLASAKNGRIWAGLVPARCPISLRPATASIACTPMTNCRPR